MLKIGVVRLSLLAVMAAASGCGGADAQAPVEKQVADASVPESTEQASSPPAAGENEVTSAATPPAETPSVEIPAPQASSAAAPAVVPETAPVTIQERTALASVPYALPEAGKAVSIGTNVADSIRPPQLSRFDWAYSLF